MWEHRNQNKSILKSLYYREGGLRYCHHTLLNIHIKISGLLRKIRDILCEISKHIRGKNGKKRESDEEGKKKHSNKNKENTIDEKRNKNYTIK